MTRCSANLSPSGPPQGGRRGPALWAAVFLLATLAFFLAFRRVHWHDMAATVARARPGYLAAACAVLSLSFYLRGLRWRLLLAAEKRLGSMLVFWASMVGYLGNFYLPARAGELIRSALLGRRASLSVSYVLATALTERISDVIALALISVGAVTAVPASPQWLTSGASGLAVLALAALVLLYLASRLRGGLGPALARLPLRPSLHSRLAATVGQFLLGTRAIHQPLRALGFTGLTGAIWLMDALSAVIAARALLLPLSLPQALVLLAALGISSALPSTPGAVGIYQLVAVTVLMPFGYSRDAALAYILTAQACSYAVVSVWGLAGLWQLCAARERAAVA